MRFGEAYEGWNKGRLTQEEAASLLGVSDRTFRRYLNRFEAEGESGLLDKRLEQGSKRAAPVDEVLALQEQYRRRHPGWNARHFHSGYQREGGRRSYSWVKTQLQTAGLLERGQQKGAHRKKRERR
ncbi:MAG: helix-turn-helix domain-containing protein, partial [Zoogloeaceae bacterium]|nr:helix-turn-helix domain-containing protein [Zoogloeaceae bacterium]